jgi:hypothetical protein
MVVVWTLVTASWNHPNGALSFHWRQTSHQCLKMVMATVMATALKPGYRDHLLFSATCDE